MVCFDFDIFAFILDKMADLHKKVKVSFKYMFDKDSMIVFSVVNAPVKNIIYKLLPLRLFCHVFQCVQGSNNPKRYRFFTRVFFDDIDFSSYLEHKFKIQKDELKGTSINSLAEVLKTDRFMFNLHLNLQI